MIQFDRGNIVPISYLLPAKQVLDYLGKNRITLL
jgi:hypothetical protein